MMKVTIVTVCYNAVKEIEKTILSVINQTYDDVEYIIVDGASTDGTLDIINKYKDRITKWVSEPDKGIYDAMNKGIKLASGDYLNFMNAGDWFVNKYVLENLRTFLTPGNDAVYGDGVVERIGIKYVSKARGNELANDDIPQMGFIHQSLFVRTELAKRYPFDLRYKLAADFNMVITLYRNGCHFAYCGFPIAYYDLTGVSSSNIRQHRYECLCIRKPDEMLKNRILAYWYYINKTVKETLKQAVIVVCPQLIIKRNDSISTYKRYVEDNFKYEMEGGL